MKKKLLVLAAAGALTAATAVPALALENEFHGAFTTFYDLSNYSAIGNENTGNATGLSDDAPTQNYFVERVRLGYTAKASDQVKLVTRFEFDYNFWGNSSYVNARGGGGAIGADSVNMETKTLYLDLNYPAIEAKIGMMPNTDVFKGLIFDADMAGILLSHNYANANVSAGFFRWNSDSPVGKNTNDMISLDGKYAFSKNFKLGAGYYYITDDRGNGTTTTASAAAIGETEDGTLIYPVGTVFTTTENPANDAEVHTLGLNAEGVIGPVTLNGFALMQFGDRAAGVDAKGYAFNVGARMPLAGGTLRSEFLYVAGGSNALYNAGDGYESGQFYDSELVILGRDKNATTIDNAIIYNVENFGQGTILGTVGYDYAFTDKLSASANAGFAAIENDDNPSYAGGDSNYLGTEINAEANYQLTPNVTLGARAAYVFLGDYFDGLDADDPYDVKVLVRYAF